MKYKVFFGTMLKLTFHDTTAVHLLQNKLYSLLSGKLKDVA
jgi:hypothetical protein